MATIPLGHITLPVTFGNKDNWHREFVTFEATDMQSGYHVILGRLALAKFMTVPHYACYLLKMPGPKGILSIRGDVNVSNTCDIENLELAEALNRKFLDPSSAEAMETNLPKDDEALRSGSSDQMLQSGAPTKKINLVLLDVSKTAIIGAELQKK